jgi:hypothetical protein
MAYQNKFDKTGESFVMGDDAESSFKIAGEKKGWIVTKSSLQEEFSHIDFYVKISETNSLSVDVKARKKVKRSDTKTNDELIWIEFQNVKGNRGWLYGKADCIAFERENDFLVVNRKTLARLCEKLVDLTKVNTDITIPLYTGYQRYGRQDMLSLIKMSDIINGIKYSLLKK